MTTGRIRRALKSSPWALRTWYSMRGLLPTANRQTPAFRELYDRIAEAEFRSAYDHEHTQLELLKKLTAHAYAQVPHYREAWHRIGFVPQDIRSLEDIRKLPFTTKATFQDNPKALIAQSTPKRKLAYVTTGGSTGIPFGFYEAKGTAEAREWAFMCRQWERVGYKQGDRSVVIRGSVIPGASSGNFSLHDPARGELLLSSYHLTDRNLPRYLDLIREYNAPFIQAYPSAITTIADYMRREKIAPIPFIKAIFAGSENLYDWQRDLIADTFQCRIYSWYGHAEKAVLGGECEHSTHYHLFPEYGYVELIDRDGNPITRPGQTGEIVATGFNNLVMPFIRYRTMDLGAWQIGDCACGRHYPMLARVEGRLQELIVTGDGRLISMAAVNMHGPVFDNVRQFQFVQNRPGEVEFHVVRKHTYSERDTQEIRAELGPKLGDHMTLRIEFTDEIPRTPTGKYRFLIQHLPIKYHDR